MLHYGGKRKGAKNSFTIMVNNQIQLQEASAAPHARLSVLTYVLFIQNQIYKWELMSKGSK